ncbi:LPD7 domain-containing protein [Paraburkholderia terricola]|uniref:RNase H-like HicB family nuclease n=1 Tax=Paraburkholderia terricola TaxID=169427 RepID=A0ABU1M1T9_9BURK|nr:LPD7 domain-containing protein [Paraburkholderia terricola]MDR6412988.1 putative RNase H-like HicB family nuclease [Paraburkholderia terricola]MDR6484816.1 putative RNase H-like HicB family nuclease [Paraburkholderia terricola]
MNEIEFPVDRIDYRERDAANADDASTIRARVTPPANEPDAGAVPGSPETPVDDATEERLKKIRAADREKAEQLLKRDPLANSATNSSTSTATDEAVKPAAGTGKPLGKKGNDAENSIRPKPVFDKTGYNVPKSVSNQYVAHDGKFLDRKSETVHFEDKGRSLSTASEDREVIVHMVEVAKAKNWGELQLKGSEEFRRQAWIVAQLAGVPTRGFKPASQDRAALTAAREAMRIGAGDRTNNGEAARTNSLETTADQKQDAPGPASPVQDPAAGAFTGPVPASQATRHGPSPTVSKTGQQTRQVGQPAAGPQPASSSLEQSPAGVTSGVLVAHGAAPFNHDEKQNPSYYATVRTASGECTVWGLDLERAIGESGVQPGQRIELEKGGSKEVTAMQRQFDESGKELAPKSVTSRRNEWLVFSPDVPGLPTREQREALTSVRREVDERRRIDEARERFLNGDWKYSKEQQKTLEEARERIKAQAAREVLRDEIKGLPEQQQEKLMGEFESAVAEARAANRPLDVPMPQVSDATIKAVREQIEQERRGQAHAAQQTTQRATPERGQDPQSQSAEHDGPTLEMEP